MKVYFISRFISFTYDIEVLIVEKKVYDYFPLTLYKGLQKNTIKFMC